jgi:hypothetical protein
LSTPSTNWLAFERELRTLLEKQLDADAVQRVIDDTRNARERLLLSNLVGSIAPEFVAQVERHETWHKDFRAAKMKMLLLLIESFVVIESGRTR